MSHTTNRLFVCHAKPASHLAHWSTATLLGLLFLVTGCARNPAAPIVDRTPSEHAPVAVIEQKKPSPIAPVTVRQQLQKFSRLWEGVRYQLGGEDEHGIDCSALSVRVYKDLFAQQLPRTTTAQLTTGRPIGRDDLLPGDLVFFRLPGGDKHVGVFVGDGRFLHASLSRGVMTSSLHSPYWHRHYLQATRPNKADKPAD